jgi:hypothetical protein
MNLSKINSELFKHKYFHKYFIFLFIFTFGVGMLLYQIYVNSIQTSIIEGLSLDTSNPAVSSLLERLSGFFQKQCLTGCVRLDAINKEKCEQRFDENGNKIYDCPWVCDTKKFENNLKNNPRLATELSTYQRCSPDTEKRDCGRCVPNRVFNV